MRQRSLELKHTEAGGQGVADSHSKLHKQDFKINPVETSAQYTMLLAGKEELWIFDVFFFKSSPSLSLLSPPSLSAGNFISYFCTPSFYL